MLLAQNSKTTRLNSVIKKTYLRLTHLRNIRFQTLLKIQRMPTKLNLVLYIVVDILKKKYITTAL